MQSGQPPLSSNWRVMFVVALTLSLSAPQSSQPLSGWFCSTNQSAKQRWAEMGRGKAVAAAACLWNEEKNPKIVEKLKREQPGRPSWPHPGGDWNVLELSQTSGRCSELCAPLACWLVRQLFLNWKLTVTRQQVGTFTTSWSLPSEQNPVILAH